MATCPLAAAMSVGTLCLLFSTPCCAIEFLNWASASTVLCQLSPFAPERATVFPDREMVSRCFPMGFTPLSLMPSASSGCFVALPLHLMGSARPGGSAGA